MNAPKRILSVKPLKDYQLKIHFEDGTRIVDMKSFDLRGVFKKLVVDERLFRTAHLDPEFGTVTWEGGLMLENNDLYDHGQAENIRVAVLKKALSRLVKD